MLILLNLCDEIFYSYEIKYFSFYKSFKAEYACIGICTRLYQEIIQPVSIYPVIVLFPELRMRNKNRIIMTGNIIMPVYGR